MNPSWSYDTRLNSLTWNHNFIKDQDDWRVNNKQDMVWGHGLMVENKGSGEKHGVWWKRYYAKTVDWSSRRLEQNWNNTAVKLKQVQYICPIFRFEKRPKTNVLRRYSFSFSPRRRFVFQTEISGKYTVLVSISVLYYFFSSLRRGDQSTVFCIVSIDFN